MVEWHHWIKGYESSKLREIVEDREVWCAAVHGVPKSWRWLSDWMTTIMKSRGVAKGVQSGSWVLLFITGVCSYRGRMTFICGNQGGEKGGREGRRELKRRVKEGRNNQPRNRCKLANGTRHNPMDPVLNSGRYPFLLNAMPLTFPGKIPALWVSLDMLLYRMSIIWGCVLRKLRQFFSAIFLFPFFAFIPTSSPLTSSNMRKCSKLRVG